MGPSQRDSPLCLVSVETVHAPSLQWFGYSNSALMAFWMSVTNSPSGMVPSLMLP